jgi:hypothetical protein
MEPERPSCFASSKVIPVLMADAKCINHHSDESAHPLLPPEYAMIELNGELIPPVEFPTKDVSRAILGTEQGVELGKLKLDKDNKASTSKAVFERRRSFIYSLIHSHKIFNADTYHDSGKSSAQGNNRNAQRSILSNGKAIRRKPATPLQN